MTRLLTILLTCLAGCTHQQAEHVRQIIESEPARQLAATIPWGELALGGLSVLLAGLAEWHRRRARRITGIAEEIVTSVEPALSDETRAVIRQSEPTRAFVRKVRIKNGK